MSFYDDASIIMIPTGVKASKLYCAKPTDGSGDLTFTRTGSTATRVNSAGLIEECRTNLLLNSATLSTQNVTVVAAPYTLSFFGTGTVTLSGTGSGSLVGTGANDRVSLTFTPTAGTLTLTVSGSVTSAQLEIGNVMTNYIATTSAAVTVGTIANIPRLDYTGGGCPKLLLEPTRTNSVIYSEMFDNSAWTKSLTDVSGNMIVSPDGYQSADLLIPNTTLSSSHRVERGGGSVTTPNIYTGSVFVKYGGYDYVNIELTNYLAASFTYRFSTGVISNATGAGLVAGSPKAENYGNGWIRLSLSSTLPSGNGTAVVRINFRNNSNSANFAGDGVSGVYAWGYQLELGSNPTSYIPTWNASVTRNLDICVKNSISSLIGQTEGTFFADITITNTSQNRSIFAIDINSTTDFITGIINSPNTIVFNIRKDSVFTTLVTSSSITLGRHKLAFAYKSGEYALYIDGVQIGLSTSTQYPSGTLSQLIISNTAYGQLFDGFNQAILFKTRLSNSDLATLTTI